MNKKIILVSLAAYQLLFSIHIFSQTKEEIIARVGKETINAKEFQLRYELSPYIPNDKNIDPDSIKYDFLYSLIAEKLWAKDAEDLGLLNSKKFKSIFKPLEEMFARDALFKKEVENKVLISAKDMNDGIIKSQTKLITQIVSTNDSIDIYKFYNQLKPNDKFDSLVSSNPKLIEREIDITLGTLKDEEIEDSLYSLAINDYTFPIKSDVGWVIFRIGNKIFTPVDLSNQQIIDNIKKIIRDRRIEKRYDEYLKELLSGITIHISPESFALTFSKIWNVIKFRPIINDSVKFFELSEIDFDKINSSLNSSELNKELFSLSDKIITVEKFLNDLAFVGFSVTQLDSMTVLQKVSQKVKKFVEEQMITEEAYRQGLIFDSQVQSDLKIWRENYLARLFYKQNLDSIRVKENDIYNYYLDEFVNISNIRLINLRLISIKDLDEVSRILDLLKQGFNFGDIISSYGKTDSLVNDIGETGLKPVLLLGYVGNVASDLKLNEVYGPIKRNDSYTILQVIERKDSNDSLKLSFASIKDQLRNDLRFKYLRTRLNKITSILANKNTVKIYSDVLDKIKTSSIPMFVHRLMGFGGRIAGVPLTLPFSDWITKENKQKLLP
jgi:parvulin-like peptidyl-prolyl isomerase